ncbi:MAG TPA: LamG-like jellyroll fold domain-containing protein [Bryobacteraceae bacterium]|nr:LamG-like jellyroll fold domain-containing protein [Bryobacteraceae bacterium]
MCRTRHFGLIGGVLLLSGILVAQTPTTLVAAYGFNEGSGSTVTDLSGNGNNGTITDATWSPSGKFGSALVFNGTSARVNINDSVSLHLSSVMTVEAWINPSAVTSVWRDVIYKGVDSIYLEATSDHSKVPAAGGTFGDNDIAAFGTSALALNVWVHLAETYDGSTIRLYVNGVQVSSLAQTGAIAPSAKPLQIGGDSDWGQYFKGAIDEIRVYNGALTAAQIQTDMNTPLTAAGPDTQAPSAPANLAATAISSSQINLTWTASTDNVAVTGYLVERCSGAGCTNFTQIATPSGTSNSDRAVTPGSSYTYRVRATDAAGNLSGYSNLSTASTPVPDTQAPSAPGSLAASASSGQIGLTWTASTDNVSVTQYLIERCEGSGCSSFTQFATATSTSYNDAGLAAQTSYSYRVRATDTAGNLGSYSNTATATTPAAPSGLVAAYNFNEGAGTLVADSSGNGNTGTIANATWTTSGKFGNALVFNGTNARVNISDSVSLHLSSAMTVEAWINPSAVTSAWRDVIYKGLDSIYLEATSDRSKVPAAGGTFGGNDIAAFGTSALALNIWVHLAETYDGSTVRLYVNGVLVSSLAQTGAIAPSAKPLQIGGDSDWGQYFKGTIDEIRIYNIALTAAQIQTDMNAPLGDSGNYPAVTLSTSTVTFGNQSVNVQSSPQTVTVTNTGAASLTISSVTVGGTNAVDFSQTNTCSAAIAVNGTCTVSILFKPTATGARAATLSLADNAASSPQTVTLAGNGIVGLSISPGVTVLTPTGSQQFTASASGVTWSVDGVVGGNSASGLITTGGLYTPPAAAGTHTITATSADGSLTGRATVYVSTYAGTFTYHNDNFRTGQNLNETVLTPLNVSQTQFGKLASYALDGIAFASPLYVANVNVPGKGFHNMIFVATEHDSVYAFDADGLSSSPIWKVSFLNPASGVTTVPAADTGETGDIPTEIGITGTPVIDSSTSTLYVVAKTKEVSGGTTNYVQRLHALDIATGAEKFGSPVVLQASVPGSGDGAQGSVVPFVSLRENQRPGLLLSNGVVYIAFASHGDQRPWHGWVLGYNATSLQQVMAYNVTPNDYGGGIWQGGCALAADDAGNIYFVTGNGAFDVNTGGSDYGDSFVKLQPNGTVADYFTPHDQASMDAGNLDLGSGGSALLLDQSGPYAHLIVSAGKGGTVYVVNRDNMGHYNAGNDDQIVQVLPNIFQGGTPEPGNFSSPVYFNGYIYFSAINTPLEAFQMTNGLLSTSPVSQTPETYSYPGGTMALSANQTSNGILWTVQRTGSSSPGVLRAYDATNLAIELYNSGQAGTRDTLDVAAKYSIPLVANGKVFVGSMSKLTIYGLLP